MIIVKKVRSWLINRRTIDIAKKKKVTLLVTSEGTSEADETPTLTQDIEILPEKMVPPRRFERPTCGLGNRRSIHLSYGGTPVILHTHKSVATNKL